MASNFAPPDISPICAEQAAPLTQCSQGGFIFLALVTRLFGGSIDNKYSKRNPYAPPSSDNFDLKPLEVVKDELQTTVTHEGQKCSESEFYLDSEYYNKYDEVPVANFDSEQAILNHNFLKPKFFDDNNGGKIERHKKSPKEYDFIIVGAGSAGCVIANRLTEFKNWKVLLIEAGPEEPDVTSVPAFAGVMGRSNVDWKFRTQPDQRTCLAQRGQTCAMTCGRVMGGSSATNYLTYMRGNKRDYDVWADLGNEGWSYKDVLPYFKKSENNTDIEGKNRIYHGVNGPLTVERFSYVDQNNVLMLNAFIEKGLRLTDFNGAEQLGTMITQTTSKDGKRVSTNAAFIRTIRDKRQNLDIMTNTTVTGVIVEPNKKIACGVTYIQNGVVRRVYARKEVIVSAGTYNSVRLLMSSGIGPKDELGSLSIPVFSNLKVGHNLQDHVTTEAMLIELSNKTSTSIDINQINEETIRYYKSKNKDGVLAQTGILGISAFITTQHAQDKTAPDIQYHFDGRNQKDFYADPTTYLATETLPFPFYDSLNVRPVLITPESRGYVTLNRTNPIFGQPLIYAKFLTKQRDLDTLIAALKYIVTLEDTQTFKENEVKFIRRSVKGCTDYTWGTDEYFACIVTRYTGTIFHPVGTCKMGPKSDKTAVVSPRLKVYGIKHLRVANNAIMPNIIRGNTNSPAIMIGEKVADMIKEDWKPCCL